MSIASELQTLNDKILDAYDAVNGKGGSIPSAKNMANLPMAINSITTGSSTAIEALTVTENGIYTAPTGTAYSPVTVNVSGGGASDNNWAEVMRGESTALYDNTISATAANYFDLGSNSSNQANTALGKVVSASFPALRTISGYTFRRWVALETIYLPSLTYMNGSGYDFYYCQRLKEFIAPSLSYILSGNAFQYCSVLKKVDLGNPTRIPTYFFSNATAVEAFIIRKTDAICTLQSANSISGATKIVNGTGYIYVPSALVSSYQTANYWSAYSNQIRAIEDYSDDGTVDGDINV